MPSMCHRAALVLALCAASAASHAAVLGSFAFDETYAWPLGPGAEPPPPPAFLILHLGYSATPGALEAPDTMVFDGVPLVGGSAPFTVTLGSAADDAELPLFLALASNGNDDEVRFDIIGNQGGGLGYADLESAVVGPLGGFPGPDLHGALLTGLELTVDTLLIQPVSAFGQEAWHISGELRVLGEFPAPVPLPGALWLFGSALVLGRARRGAMIARNAPALERRVPRP